MMRRLNLLGIAVVALSMLTAGARVARAQAEGVGSISGSVLGEDNKPYVGLAVKLIQQQYRKIGDRSQIGIPLPTPMVQSPKQKVIATATTDKEGKFTFARVNAGDYFVSAGNPNIGYIYEQITVEKDKETKLDGLHLTK